MSYADVEMERRGEDRFDLERSIVIDEFSIPPPPVPAPPDPKAMACPLCSAKVGEPCRSYQPPYAEMPVNYHEQRVRDWRPALQMTLDGQRWM